MTLDDIIKKRYPFFDPVIYGKEVELDSIRVKELMCDLISVIVEMYVPDGNPEIWLNKIQDLMPNTYQTP